MPRTTRCRVASCPGSSRSTRRIEERRTARSRRSRSPRAAGRRGLLALGLALAGCGGAQTPPATLVVAGPSALVTNLPYASADGQTSSILANVFEPLVDFEPDLSLSPALADSWQTPDDRTWIFELREGVLRHDGEPLGVGDVVAALERARSDPRSRLRPELSAVTAIEPAGEHSLRIRTAYPYPVLPNRLASVPIAVERGEEVLGTGPFRLVAWDARGASLEAFAGHRSGAPAVRSLEFVARLDTQERLALLARGAADLVTDLGVGDRARAVALPGVRVVARPGLTVVFLGMDCARGATPYVAGPRNPFRDVRVRRAVALALDRPEIVAGPLGGLGEVVDQVVGPAVFGYNPALAAWPHDPAAARALLAEAGFPDGFQVVLDALVTQPERDRRVFEAVTRQLAEAGIRVELREAGDDALLKRVETRDTSFFLMEWISTSGDFGITAEYLLHAPDAVAGTVNGGGYANPAADRLIAEASRTLVQADRNRLLRKLAALVHDDVALVPLYRLTDLYAVREGVEFEPRLDRQVRAADIRRRAAR